MADPQTPQDPFEAFRRLWGPLGVPVPGLAMPTLDPQEVDKRIAEMKSVEGWLAMNLNMLRLAIQGLEMQKATLAAMRAGADAGKEAAGAVAQHTNPIFWPWSAMQQAMGATTVPEAQDPAPPTEEK